MDQHDAATSTDAVAPAKPHFVVLDGLRGVAAVTVVIFHLFEAWNGSDPQKQIVNHGYLAVDFFFLLSGFVVAYAYDERWGRMTTAEFFTRRLVRLQPMVIAGMLIGAALWPFQHYSIFANLPDATAWQVALALVAGCLMIPLPRSADIRGWEETYPLNGPAWSLFYEYLANVAYALVLRRVPNLVLALLVALAAAATVHLLVWGPRGDMIGGWSLDAKGLTVGFTRVAFPFTAGLLLMRLGGRLRSRQAFAVASLLLVVALALPRFGGPQLWINGLYEAGCVILLFPLIVALGAGEQRADGVSIRVARVFGDLSYPIYITHYPLIYIYTGWVVDAKPTVATGALVGAGVFALSVAIAWACLNLYDEPVRRALAARLLTRRESAVA
jgi:peptidoglycan/LPS O-acetylase OafA/YrhL